MKLVLFHPLKLDWRDSMLRKLSWSAACRVFVKESGAFVFKVQLKVRDSSHHSCVPLSQSKE